MLSTFMVSLIFFAVCIIVQTVGIFTFQSNYKAPANRLFLALSIAIIIWSSGMALSTIASDAARSEIFRRFSAIGWSTFYAILLHFILTITGKTSLYKKRCLYLCLYLPAFLCLLAFVIPNGFNPYPYNLQQTNYGWINVAQHNVWDWMFYAYYIGFTLIGLLTLYRWNRKATDSIIKKKSSIILLSLVSALLLGTITDVVLSSQFHELPQMAPVIMLIPLLTIYHELQRNRFNITEVIDHRMSYISLFISILAYIVLSALQIFLLDKNIVIDSKFINATAIRGLAVQIQLLISIYLVLKENKLGYITSVSMNSINLIIAVAIMIKYNSGISLPGIISNVGVLVVITLLKNYKDKIATYIKKINTQVVKEKFYSRIFNQAPVGIAIMNGKYHMKNEEFEDISINPMYTKILGRTKEELQNVTWRDITHPDDLDADLAYYKQLKTDEIAQHPREKRYIKPDGSIIWANMSLSQFASLGENVDSHICIISDITERKRIENNLKYNNEHDLLTGLYNRVVLEKTLNEDAIISSPNKRALVCLNLSNMHTLNFRYGFRYSQTILKRITDSLRAFCNENYILFTPSEYSFIFYVKDYGVKKELDNFCEKVSEILRSYLYAHGIGTGIGILRIDQSNVPDTDTLLKKLMNTSEIAAKNSNSTNIIFYSPELDAQIVRENDIGQEITEIVSGTKTDRLYLQFQPIFDIASNRVTEFEALARLNSEKYGLVPPLEFISIAEKMNLIVPLGEKITLLALHFLDKLKENGHNTISVTINISMIQILDNDFADRLLQMVKGMHLNPERIGIELTESIFATNRAEINSVINLLRAAGLKILMDDFGTGYSSFSRARELNIDYLKVDKSFIDKLLVLKPEEAITGDIISMAHKLNDIVIAEGVEYEKQFSYLRDHGCDKIQGYLISKPLDQDVALDFLEKDWSVFEVH